MRNKKKGLQAHSIGSFKGWRRSRTVKSGYMKRRTEGQLEHDHTLEVALWQTKGHSHVTPWKTNTKRPFFNPGCLGGAPSCNSGCWERSCSRLWALPVARVYIDDNGMDTERTIVHPPPPLLKGKCWWDYKDNLFEDAGWMNVPLKLMFKHPVCDSRY